MKRKVKNINYIIAYLLVATLLLMGVGYSAITSNLSVAGTVKVPKNIIELSTKIRSANTLDTSDSAQHFITSSSAKNYVWYSGKMWRAVSINPSDNTVKLVTDDSVSVMGAYSTKQRSVYSDSFMRQWLNDTATDGFYGSLYNASSYIKTNSSWNATLTSSYGTKPANTTMITDAVGLLNSYELKKTSAWSNNNQYFFTMTPSSSTSVWVNGNVSSFGAFSGVQTGLEGQNGCMIRPVVNILSTVKVYDGSGTKSSPFLLLGDTGAYNGYTGQLVNRYSGEYVNFSGKRWRIVSTNKSNNTVKLVMTTSATNRAFSTSSATGTNIFSTTNTATVGYYLNNTFYNSLTSSARGRIVTSKWYVGYYDYGTSWKLQKCSTVACSAEATSVSAKVGMLRNSELMSGQVGDSVQTFWSITPRNYQNQLSTVGAHGSNYGYPATSTTLTQDNTTIYVRPAVTITSSAVTSGKGTSSSPWNIGY